MRVFLGLLVGVLLFASMSGCSESSENKDVLFQASTLDALLQGDYDGDMTYKELKEYGDFGLGTFDALDGEMVALEGGFYQVKGDGSVHPVDDSLESSFAAVTFFEADKSVSLSQITDYDDLKESLDELLPAEDIFYAIKITGTFQYLEARSVPSQEKPYPILEEALEGQTVFKFNDIEGTMVGLWCPDYIGEVNASGYHFHFINEDRDAGGHVLECQADDVEVTIDYTSEFRMILPGN